MDESLADADEALPLPDDELPAGPVAVTKDYETLPLPGDEFLPAPAATTRGLIIQGPPPGVIG